MEITSINNERIKNLIKLKQKKYRDESNLILIEGYKIYQEALKEGIKAIDIYLTKEMQEKINIKDNFTIISEEVSKKLTFNITSQNFFAVVQKPKQKNVDGNFLILDNIQDPQNLGAIIRTSVATNIKKLYFIGGVDIYNDKVIRASMGNVFKISYENICIENLREICKDKIIYSADMSGENVFKAKKPDKTFGLILGNEGNGVSSEVQKFATQTLSIPMHNNVESLNVAVSMGVISYYLTTD